MTSLWHAQVAAVMQSGRLNVWSCHMDAKQRLQGSHLAASQPASGPVLAAAFVSATERETWPGVALALWTCPLAM